jgi:hypothetical protein
MFIYRIQEYATIVVSSIEFSMIRNDLLKNGTHLKDIIEKQISFKDDIHQWRKIVFIMSWFNSFEIIINHM